MIFELKKRAEPSQSVYTVKYVPHAALSTKETRAILRDENNENNIDYPMEEQTMHRTAHIVIYEA